MCGRYASFRQAQDLADAFDIVDLTEAARGIDASWNVAPTMGVRIVVDRPVRLFDSSGTESAAPIRRSMQAARWGLVPPWSKSLAVGARMINARAETAAEKPSFKKPFVTSRCLVLADGYFEWQTREGKKTPFYIHPTDGAPIAFAGLFSWWPNPEVAPEDPARWVLSTTILTASARDGLEEIHEREPVMLTRDLIDAWLDPTLTSVAQVQDLIHEPGPGLTWHPVGRAVGNVRHDSPSNILPVDLPAPSGADETGADATGADATGADATAALAETADSAEPDTLDFG